MKRFVIPRAILAASLGASPLLGQSEKSPLVLPAPLKDARPSGLVLPSRLPPNDYERVLYEFLFTRKYQQLGRPKTRCKSTRNRSRTPTGISRPAFIHRVHEIKDNRLLARGGRDARHFAGPDHSAKIIEEFMLATGPEGGAMATRITRIKGPIFPARTAWSIRSPSRRGLIPSG